jgi:F-box domain
MLNMIFNRVNFHGHLRLSAVCKKWFNLVQDDLLFMRTVKFIASKMSREGREHELMRYSYRYVCLDDHFSNNLSKNRTNNAQSLEKLLKNAEKIDFGRTNCDVLNYVVPLSKNLRKIHLYDRNYSNEQRAMTFEHPLPVEIVSTNVSAILDRFNAITNISSLILDNKNTTEEFMAKYAAVVKSISLDLNYVLCSMINCLGQIDNLHLQSLDIIFNAFFLRTEEIKDSLQLLFTKQAPSLKSLNFASLIDGTVFDSMRMLLVNLETVHFEFYLSFDEKCLRLNDLKVLRKLKSLHIVINTSQISSRQYSYHLDVAELTTLTDLRIATTQNGTRLRISSSNEPMEKLEKFEVSCLRIDIEALRQIAMAMPELKVLNIGAWVGNFSDNLLKIHSVLYFFGFVFIIEQTKLESVRFIESCNPNQQVGASGIPDRIRIRNSIEQPMPE